MKENDPIKNLTEATPEGHPARAPERHPCSCASVGTNREAHLPGCPRPSSAQRAVAHCREGRHRKRHVSPHGARLLTRRFWRAEEHPWLAPLTSDFRQRGRALRFRGTGFWSRDGSVE